MAAMLLHVLRTSRTFVAVTTPALPANNQSKVLVSRVKLDINIYPLKGDGRVKLCTYFS